MSKCLSNCLVTSYESSVINHSRIITTVPNLTNNSVIPNPLSVQLKVRTITLTLDLTPLLIVLANPTPTLRWAKGATLALIGMSRNAGDEERINNLRKEARELQISDQVTPPTIPTRLRNNFEWTLSPEVEFRINLPFPELCEVFKIAKVPSYFTLNNN